MSAHPHISFGTINFHELSQTVLFQFIKFPNGPIFISLLAEFLHCQQRCEVQCVSREGQTLACHASILIIYIWLFHYITIKKLIKTNCQDCLLIFGM